MAELSTISQLACALGTSIGPLAAQLADDSREAFLQSLGLRAPPGLLALPPVASAMASTAYAAAAAEQCALDLRGAAARADGDGGVMASGALLLATAQIATAVGSLAAALDDASVTLPGLSAPQRAELHAFAASLLPVLRDRVITDYLRDRSPGVSGALLAGGLVELVDSADGGAGSLRVASSARRLRLDRFSTALRDPVGHLRSVYGWGTPAFDGATLFRNLKAVLDDRAIAAEILAPPGLPPGLEAVGFRLGVDHDVSPPGLDIALRFPASIALTDTVTSGEWQLPVQATVRFDTDVEAKLAPPLDLALASAGESAQITLSAEASRSAASDTFVLVGDGNASRLEAFAVALGISLDSGTLSSSSGRPFALRLHGALQQGKVVISGQGDSLIARVLGGRDITARFDVNADWDSYAGLQLAGQAGLEIEMPVHADLGPAFVDSLHLGLELEPAGVSLEISVTAGAALGPITVVLDRVGIAGHLGVPETGGNLGFAQLDLGWQPPRGAGIQVQAGPVQGGGLLSIGPTAGTYEGAIALEVLGVGLSALGVLATRPAFSFAMVVSAKTVGIPLGLGFLLDGVGGLLGIDRRVDVDVLRAAIRSGGMDDIFFPANPIVQATRLLGDLGRYFPPAHGRYIFGPSAKIGWGTPRVFSGVVAVLIELPSPVRLVLLAQLRLGLPSLDKPIVDIRLDALGVLDFDRATLALDASLHDSKLAGYALTGDMALRLGWGDAPQFLLSLGGFHPHFTPPPGFPALRRLALTAGDNPQLRLSAYLALTSNTAQVGAQADLTAHGGGFEIKAHVGFDALFEFVPFHFETEITASAAISWHGHRLLGVDLDFLLSGPHPWHAKGDASFGILWWDVSVGFDTTWGDATPAPLPPPPPIAGALKDALGRTEAWSSELSAGEPPWVTLAPPAGPTSTIVVHPFAALVVRERAVPLGYRITQFGNIPLAAPQQFDITGVRAATSPPTTVATTPVTDAFGPGQFTRLSSDQRLAAPSFESFASGVRMADAEIRLGASARSTMDLDTEVVDPLAPPARPPHVLVPPAIAVVGPTVRPTRAPAPPPRTGPRLADLAFVLASIDDLSITAEGAAIAAGSTRYAALRESLAARVAATGRIPRLQIVPRVQVSNHTAHVVVVRQDDRMRNVDFVDTLTGRGMTRAEFVDAIHAGLYPDYYVRSIHGVPTPVSKPNTTPTDNLG